MNITVVAAVIEQEERFLVTRRPTGVHLAGLWEFPGGKIDADESHHAAFKREIREELDAEVEVGELDIRHDARLPRSHGRCTSIAARCWARRVRCSARRCGGSARPELHLLGFPPADAQLIERLTKSDVR